MERTLHEKTLLDGIFAPIEEKEHPVKCIECGWKGRRARLLGVCPKCGAVIVWDLT